MPRWRERRERVRRGATRRKRVARRAEALSQSHKTDEPDGAETDAAEASADAGILQVPVPPDPLGVDATGRVASDPQTGKRGWWQQVVSRLRPSHAPRSPERAVGAHADDPVRRILAVPRGAARLDAFQDVLRMLPPGTHGHRGVALAFHRELVTLSMRAQVDLALLRNRVEFCAESLLAAGESEKAAHLLANVGKKKRAAELFVASGSIDALEEVHAALDEGAQGEQLSARLAYERFDALYALGQRKEALAALEQAESRWPENGVYAAIAERFRARIPKGQMALRLRTPEGQELHVSLHGAWPLSIGRNDDNALHLASPLVSREHLEVLVRDDTPWVRDRVGRADCELDGEPLRDARALRPEGALRIAGLDLRYAQRDGHLYLECPSHGRALIGIRERNRAICLMEHLVPGELWIALDLQGYFTLYPKNQVVLEGESRTSPLLLMTGDRLSLPGLELWIESI